jgi:hypothetical protein
MGYNLQLARVYGEGDACISRPETVAIFAIVTGGKGTPRLLLVPAHDGRRGCVFIFFAWLGIWCRLQGRGSDWRSCD